MLTTNNVILDAIYASTAVGPLGPYDLMAPSLTSTPFVTARVSDKFQMGFLGGVGGSSQFQSHSQMLPVLPPSSNRDFEQRIAASRGLRTGERLLTRFERPGNFNPGLGTDTWRGGENVTWTMANRGDLTNVNTGLAGPLSYKGLDRMAREALAPFSPRNQGLDANIRPPCVIVTNLSMPNGMSLADMQRASASAITRYRLKRGMVKKPPLGLAQAPATVGGLARGRKRAR